MSNNPKITIALAFALTLLIGIGAGYLLRGGIQSGVSEQVAVGQQEEQSNWSRSDRPDRGQRERAEREDRDRRVEDREVRREDREFRGQDRQDRPGGGERREQYHDRDNDGERRDYSRFRNRLQEDLGLTDEKAEELFAVLREHRETIKHEMSQKRERMSEVVEELKQELEEELSGILTEEQWEIWQEKFTPRKDRQRRNRDTDENE